MERQGASSRAAMVHSREHSRDGACDPAPHGAEIAEPGWALGDLFVHGIGGEAVELVRLFVKETNKIKSTVAFISLSAIL